LKNESVSQEEAMKNAFNLLKERATGILKVL
jgi:hypothetical protein